VSDYWDIRFEICSILYRIYSFELSYHFISASNIENQDTTAVLAKVGTPIAATLEDQDDITLDQLDKTAGKEGHK
jgi:hypothetical protein